MPSGEMVFSWLHDDGTITNWWGTNRHRFIYHEWGKCAVAVDLELREAQILFNATGERHRIKFKWIEDETERLALEAVCDARDAAFAGQLLLRMLERHDLADKVGTRG